MKPPVFISTRPMAFTVIAVATILCAAFGRLFIFSGTSWTMLALIATAANFYLCAKGSVKLLDYHVNRTRWFISHLGVSFLYSAVATALLVFIMNDQQRRNGYYRGYDSFIVTSGDVQMLDTDGAWYTLENAGMSFESILFTALIVATCFIAATAVGTALGAMFGYRGGVAGTITTAVAAAACFVTVAAIVLFNVTIRAPWPGVLLFLVPTTIIAWLVTALAMSRKHIA